MQASSVVRVSRRGMGFGITTLLSTGIEVDTVGQAA